MTAITGLSRTANGDAHFVSPQVVGEFRVDKTHYLVIALEANAESNVHEVLKTYLEDIERPGFAEIFHFRLYHHLCCIVQLHPTSTETGIDLATLLTARELQIATLVAQGMPNKKVAKQLHISEWTVATHIRRIFAKLSVDSRAAMVFRCAPLIQRCEFLVPPN